MHNAQRGVTFIGWLFLLIPIAILVYAGIRLAPIYLNYYRVVQALAQTASETRTEGTINPTVVRASLDRRFDVEYVDRPPAKEIDIHRDGEHWVAIADYEEVVPLAGNMSILVQFHKQVELQ
jgi:hypothetical protein